MKLQFDPNQEYQLDAVKAITDIFEGQPLKAGDLEFDFVDTAINYSVYGVGNNILLTEEQILTNVQSVQKLNGIEPISELDGLNFSVEMETGTGKTYVYLRTVYELNKIYGFKKFVIVVPNIAIREGVLKNLDITHEHFQNLYDKIPVDYGVYDSGKVSQLRSFASSNTVQILVMNIDAFAKDENVINKPNDKLTGKKPIEFIQYTQPIVIVDEPQNMETENRKRAVENLNPCCTLRYSATHLNLYNLVYSLDPVKAYDLGLVKQIEVDSVFAEDAFNDAYISLEGVKATKTRTYAELRMDVNLETGVSKKKITAKVGEDLFTLSNGRDSYKEGFIIEEIDVYNGSISFTNGIVLHKGETKGEFSEEIMKFQIHKTIEEHLKKELKNKQKGIKTLSLFFIDRVANYRQYDDSGNPLPGMFAQWFEEIYHQLSERADFKDLIPFEVKKVHNGYFAQDKKGKFKDIKETERSQNSADAVDAYHLIMKDKEKLLDINEPLRFIFSHSALREGWDSPNVFQICTLNETKSEMKKRQEIGRGLRLSVDQSGLRVKDRNVNRLTVIANESYEDFAKKLQSEIEEDCGVKFTGRIKRKRDRIKIEYRKGFQVDERFLELWNRIKSRTTYRVAYETIELIRAAAKAVKEIEEITKPRIKSVKVGIDIQEPGIDYNIISSKVLTPDKEFIIPDVLGYIQNKTELTRETILEILKKSGRLKDILVNPQLFMDKAVTAIKRVLYELMIDGIKYERIGNQEYEMLLFEENDLERYLDERLTFKVKDNEKTIYDEYIPLDSDIEINFAKECEQREDIEFFFKLPSWFIINTPIGKYNPDWALVFKNEKKIYFVTETKSTKDLTKIRPDEKLKIKCGKAHFEQLSDIKYKHVTTTEELI
jgi:type III restriction enzyme